VKAHRSSDWETQVLAAIVIITMRTIITRISTKTIIEDDNKQSINPSLLFLFLFFFLAKI
jgi:hypothetical protein